MRYFLKLAYDGTRFHGWQRQPNAISVQEVLEESLSTILRDEISLTGAGRTDTGVHARRMYAHFDTGEIPDQERFLRSLNRLSGSDISIERILEVPEDAHARFDAIERSYRYFVTFEKSPFQKSRAWLSPGCLDIDKMNEAASILLETEDFTSFSKLHTDVKTNICDVRKAVWTPWQTDFGEKGIKFDISADRFLRNMVRAIVGTLTDVGRGKMTLEGFRQVIEARDRCAASSSMPAHALFLWDVKYPYIPNVD